MRVLLFLMVCSFGSITQAQDVDTVIKIAIPTDTAQVFSLPGDSWFLLHRNKVLTLYNAFEAVPLLQEQLILVQNRELQLKSRVEEYKELELIANQTIDQLDVRFSEADKECKKQINQIRLRAAIAITAATAITLLVVIVALL